MSDLSIDLFSKCCEVRIESANLKTSFESFAMLLSNLQTLIVDFFHINFLNITLLWCESVSTNQLCLCFSRYSRFFS